jgi:hypothetical protein
VGVHVGGVLVDVAQERVLEHSLREGEEDRGAETLREDYGCYADGLELGREVGLDGDDGLGIVSARCCE